jgi:hypothetical protein
LFAAILTTFLTHTMALVESSAFALRKTRLFERVMTSAIASVTPIYSHS